MKKKKTFALFNKNVSGIGHSDFFDPKVFIVSITQRKHNLTYIYIRISKKQKMLGLSCCFPKGLFGNVWVRTKGLLPLYVSQELASHLQLELVLVPSQNNSQLNSSTLALHRELVSLK